MLSTAAMLRSMIASAIVLSAFSAMPANADMTTSGSASYDTRFGEIGKVGPDPTDVGETPPVTAGVSASRTGLVTYAQTRVDVPISKQWSVIPQAALLQVAPYRVGDPSLFVPYFGGGIGFRPAPSWGTEISAMFGPRTNGIESVSGVVGVSKEIGGDWSRDVPPPVALELAVGGAHFDWDNGNGPAGSTIFQAWVQAQALLRATNRFQIIPRGSFFMYDHSLDNAVGPRLGSIGVLAQVGTYAPRGVAGARVGYWLGNELVFPFVDGQQIWYAADVGNATQLAGGVRVNLGHHAYVMGMGGLLHNRVSGPLISPSYDLRYVPVVAAEVSVGF